MRTKQVTGTTATKRHALVTLATLTAVASMAASSLASAATKDVVLDRVVTPAYVTVAPASAAPVGDAMVVSVLVASHDGTLTPKSTDALFRTGDRLHLKVLASRNGAIQIYNTNPLGVTTPEPIWKGEVRVGEETITPRLRLEGNRGEDQLHVVLTPAAPEGGVLSWLMDVLKGKGKSTRKDVVLDSQSTSTSTYVVNTAGQGLTTTVRIVHQ